MQIIEWSYRVLNASGVWQADIVRTSYEADTWKVVSRGHILNRNGEWEPEPSHSEVVADNEFMARTRFYSVDEAEEELRLYYGNSETQMD